MANYCSNTIKFFCDPSNAEVLEEFRKLIEDFCKEDKYNQLFKFAEMIEGVYGFKIEDLSNNFDGRDTIDYFDTEIDEWTYKDAKGNDVDIVFFTVDIESAWAPVLPSLDLILKTVPRFSVISYEAICEEPGMEIYINTDVLGKFFDCRYRIAIFEDNSLSYEDFLSVDETEKELEALIKNFGDDSNKAWLERTKPTLEYHDTEIWINVMAKYISSNGLANLDYRDFGFNRFEIP